MSSSRSRIPSPARSMPLTPRRRETPRKTRSVCSPARSSASGRLSRIISEQALDSLGLSPFTRRSVLSDNTDINEPGRKSWWRDLGENSRDVMEVLKDNDVEPNNVFENIEVMSQEEKRYTLDLPDSSDNESIQSIVIPQRKLLKEKENQAQKKFNQFGSRETLEKLNKTNATTSNKTISIAPKKLFQTKPLSRPVFPAALLDISTNTSASEKTVTAVLETKGRVHNLFNNQQNKNQQSSKRKNMFAKFIASDSEDDLPEIQPKFFALQKKPCTGRPSLSSRGLDASMTSMMEVELDDWQLLPSSTMLDHQLNTTLTTKQNSKKSRLSKLSEAETATSSSDTSKTKQSNNLISSKNISTIQEKPQLDSSIVTRNSSKINNIILSDAEEEINKSQNKPQTSLNTSQSSIVTRSKNKSDIAKSSSNRSRNFDKSKNASKTSMKLTDADENAVKKIASKMPVAQNQNMDTENKGLENELGELAEDHEHFTLQYKDDKANEVEEINETKDKNDSNKSNKEVNASKNISQKGIDSKVNSTKNISTTDEHSLKAKNKVIEESAEMSDHNKSHISTQKINEGVIKDENTNANKIVDQGEDIEDKAQNKSQKWHDQTQMKNNDVNNQSNQISHEITQENDHDDNEDIQNEIQSENEQNKSREEQKLQNESQENQNEIKEERNESHEIQNNTEEVENESEVENNESHEEIEDQNDTEEKENESEVENNESYEEIEDQNDSEEEANESKAEINESGEEIVEQNNTEEEENESQADHNESHEKIEDEQNTSWEEIEQNESVVDDSEIECEESNESIAVSDQETDSEHNDNQENDMECEEANETTEAAAESDHNDNQGTESDHEDQIENTETPNVSHDTTGRSRKKPSITPEAVLKLCDSRTEVDLSKVMGRNTSFRKTKSLIQHQNSLEPARASMELSDGTKNSSAEGSGWDSHRTTRKTLRQTFGKDFTPRKSLRALVMEKSAKARATVKEAPAAKPLANSTEFLEPEMSTNEVEQINDYEMDNDHRVHEVSIRTRQRTIVECLQRAKKDWAEIDAKAENIVKQRLEQGRRRIEDPFKVPARATFQRPTSQPKLKAKKPLQSFIPLESLPEEFIQDLKYKPPKRFAPRNAPWLTKRLYKYLETKLEPKYKYKARVRAERFAQTLHEFASRARRRGAPDAAEPRAVDALKREMARLNFVKTHFDFYNFFHDFMPREVRVKVIPDIINKIPHPRNGVFSDIL